MSIVINSSLRLACLAASFFVSARLTRADVITDWSMIAEDRRSHGKESACVNLHQYGDS
jgi:hypothetical protein